MSFMSRLEEIEEAADQLSPAEQQELLLFLASRLRSEGRTLPPPREFSSEQIASWISEDEAGFRRFREGE